MKSSPTDPAARNYEFFCLACLLVMLLLLLQRGLALISLMPFLIGLGGIAGRWQFAMTLLLGSLAVILTELFMPWRSQVYWQDDPLADVALAASVLGYIAGQARLRGLAVRLFPADPRMPKGPVRPEPVERADPGREIAVLAASLPAWAILALFAWEQLPESGYGLGMSVSGWRLVVLTWLLGLGWIIVAGLMVYVNRRYRTAAEAALFLQDMLWRETRREQTRLYRWMAWRRLRAERRKERS